MGEPRTDNANDIIDLTRLNQEFNDQERRGPEGAEFFGKVLAAELCFRRAGGTIIDKVTFLKGLRDPGNTNEELTSEIRELAVAGDWALAEVIVTLKGTRDGRPVDGRFQNLRIFERTKDGWSCLSWFNRPYKSRQ